MRKHYFLMALSATAFSCSKDNPAPSPTVPTEYIVTTLAGSNESGRTDGKGTAATFDGPASLLCDKQGNIFVADQFNNLIRKVTPDGTVTTVVGGGGTDDWSDNKDPRQIKLHKPQFLSMANNGDLLISETGDRYYDKFNVLFRSLSSTDGVKNYVYNNPSQLFNINQYGNWGVVQDKVGNYYLLEGSSIRKITPQGIQVDKWVTDIDGGSDQLVGNQVVIDSKGNLFFPTRSYSIILKGEITKVAPDGTVSYFKSNSLSDKTEGRIADVSLGFVNLITIDDQDNLYVVTSGREIVYDRVAKISPDGTVTTLAGGSGEGYRDGKGKDALFQGVFGIAVDKAGIVYVADFNRIRKIAPAPLK